MTQRRKDTGATRPFSARSVVASTLLGIDPPRLSTGLLVRSGELFGISDGATRVALSRMVAAGELEPDTAPSGAGYRLAGPLLERHARQSASRAAERRRWKGDWQLAVVGDGRRAAADRAELRAAMARLRLAEVREGVWLRPDNLDPARAPEAAAVVDAQCARFTSRPDDEHPAALAARLWDLEGWAGATVTLRRDMDGLVGDLEAGRTDVLARAFVLSATVLRHLVADPLLPDELVPAGWPGDGLRADYDRYDRAFKDVWRAWFHRQHDG